MPFTHLASNLQFDTDSHADVSKKFLDRHIVSCVHHLVLANYEFTEPAFFGESSYSTDDFSKHLRSLVLSFDVRSDSSSFFFREIVKRARKVEILSLSFKTEPHLRTREPRGSSAPHPQQEFKTSRSQNVMRNMRALDLFDFSPLVCEIWTGDFLRAAAKKLQYLTIKFKTSQATLWGSNRKQLLLILDSYLLTRVIFRPKDSSLSARNSILYKLVSFGTCTFLKIFSRFILYTFAISQFL